MPVIAVINRKGGSGKSTFAAHVAVWCAKQGHAVMLGDVDKQQSSRNWLRRRPSHVPSVAPWAMAQNMLKVPAGISHVVLDTPGGIHGFELARVVMAADAIVMPVCSSMFDRESAAQCHAELIALPRVASGRCRIGVVGMRIDGRTHHASMMQAWADAIGVPFLGALRETQLYTRTLEKGLTLFDLPESQTETDLAQWAPVLGWLEPVMSPLQAANDGAVVRAPVTRIASSRPDSLMPAQDSMVHGSRLAPSLARVADQSRAAASTLAGSRSVVPQFLKR